MRWSTIAAFVSLAAVLVASPLVEAADTSGYTQSVEKWRQDYQATLLSDTGWLTVSGLFWLKEGENRFGSGPDNDIRLPAFAPARAGSFRFHDGITTLHLNPGITGTLNGKTIQTAELRPDSREDRLVLGTLTLYVHASGNRYAIRLRDQDSALRKSFSGLHWFPVDPTYRTTARYVPYPQAKNLESQNVLGDAIKLKITGSLTFSLLGQEYRLDAETEDTGKLFVVFRDLTAGKETYPAARFLTLDSPKDGPDGQSVELDFNKAYNPPCAYNPFTTCPLPLPGNRLKIEIPAGEKLYKHHD